MIDNFYSLLALLVLSTSLFFSNSTYGSNASSNQQPNVVLFYVDDMGWQDTSEPFLYDNNGNEIVTPLNQRYRTPNMEALADRGMKFTNAYATPVCSPSRTSLMTGKNSARHTVTNWINWYGKETGQGDVSSHQSPSDWGILGLDQSEITLPSILKNEGYRTIHVGKAHFGSTNYAQDPANIGFDINIAGTAHGAPGEYIGDYGKGTSRAVQDIDEFHNTGTFLTEVLTLKMNDAIEDAVNDGKPFFAYMSQYAVHTPFTDDPRFIDNYQNLPADERKYATLIEGMDKSLGDIITKLEQLGVAENTLVIFMSDNGGDAPHANENESNAPLRHKKGGKYEGGIRVPLMVGWASPNNANIAQSTLQIPQGSVEDDIVSVFDMFPTIANVTGTSYSHNVDGVDLSPYLKAEPGSHRQQDLLIHFPHDHRAEYFTVYREGDWKLIYNYVTDDFELYNLVNDISESNNLYNSQPNRVMQMARKMAQELNDAGAQWPEFSNGQDDPFSMPNLPNVDIDGDGIPDNIEDSNFNGLVDAGETDPDVADPSCSIGSSCDDGDTNTINDIYDTNCNCVGTVAMGCNTMINTETFESGWGIWNDGGSDARRQDNNNYASSGNFSAAIQDNTGTSVITTDNLDLLAYTEIEVNFNYYPVSMDNSNEDFWLQISTNGGSSFSTLQTWARSTDFNNNTAYAETVSVQGPFTSNTKIRFRCDASGNADDVYLDDIEIIACGNGTNNCLTVGQNCNDNDSCTTDDVYNNDCICLGIPSGDSDSDGICDANDNTNGNCMLNANCDDGDPCTTGETYDSNCNCAGGASVGNNSTSSLAPSDDTFIRGGSYAGNNYGNSTTMHIKKGGNDKYTRYGYLKFDLSQVNASQLQNAKLRLKVSSNSSSNVVQELLKTTNDNWTEANLTWNNNQFGSTSISNFTVPAAEQWIEIDVTNAVQTEAVGDDLLSLTIMSDNTNYVRYYTKESNGNEPELILDYQSCNNRIEQIDENEIKISPNPSWDYINIRLDKDISSVISQFYIYSASGKLVEVINSTSSERIFVGNLNPGLYILKVQGKDNEWHSKFLKR